ncbi:Leo1-domain-containing protein [Artomyces pyxidatus]|uniref:Leo1-domain-containing protein n=1 Tax=Artomyces pyxidatus TaxID=48021 RepID=A0ACB8SXL2_9AGAM|nr:Leo1-domain-containing protein [Artomyces pyxidatus]
MSSLAGALDSPTQSPDPNDAYLGAEPLPEDVDMQPVETDFIDAEDAAEDASHAQPEDEDMGDLFGEENNVDFIKHDGAPESTSSPSPPPPDGLSSPDRKRRQALEYEEEDEAKDVVEQRLEATVSIPNIPVPKSSDGQHWVIRMPNFVKMDSKPFHPDTYVGPEQEEDFVARQGHDVDMSIKLRVENTVRWRWTKDAYGEDRRQSNARVIRWSDGSLSLRLGKEYFDMQQVVDTSGSAHRQAFGSFHTSQGSTPATPSAPLATKAHGLTYLVAQHKRAEILQAETVITGALTLRPTDMQSETHRLLVRAVGQKHSKVARLRMAPDPHVDPERAKAELLRAAAKKPRRARADDTPRRRRAHGGAGGGRRRAGGDMWSDEDEPDFEASEDEGDERSPKKRRAREPEERRGGEYQTDDFLVADSEDEDGAARKRRAGRADDADGEEDVLDKLDAQIGQQEAERRKAREGDGEGDAMDVESEEEEEFGVRRAGGGARKRKAIGFDEEEE